MSRHALLVLCAMLLGGCCSGALCYERKSGADKVRTGALELQKLGVVYNEHVSSPEEDRTDWRFVRLPGPGKLTVQLHWDAPKAVLELTVFNVMGQKLVDGQPWGGGGRKCVVTVEEKGAYYIRVRAAGEDDASPYSLRIFFRPDRKEPPIECHDCTPGQSKCLGMDGLITCEKKSEKCNAWSKPTPCPEGKLCKDGACGAGCNECEKGTHRCAGAAATQSCQEKDGCLVWGKAAPCRGGKVCSAGACAKKPEAAPEPAPPPRPKAAQCVKGKIISMYKFRDKQTLHIEIGEGTPVRAGHAGYVLEGKTESRLPGGAIQVTKVAGRYCIATTSLDKLGMNRQVCILAE